MLTADRAAAVVGVLPSGLLRVSSVLRSTAGRTRWSPTQLPGALLAQRHTLSRSADTAWAVLTSGVVVSSATANEAGGR